MLCTGGSTLVISNPDPCKPSLGSRKCWTVAKGQPRGNFLNVSHTGIGFGDGGSQVRGGRS
jgi:hypothetical protein